MKRVIQNLKRIKLGRSKSLLEAAGATAFILVVMVLLHPLYVAATRLTYYAFCLMVVVSMWGRAWDEYQYA